jgi:thiamine biosynthesis lipoprotein
MLDLGAIGKGYAVDRAVEILREAGITNALLHGGTSSIYALGHPPEADAWKVAIEAHARVPGAPNVPLAVVSLGEESLSVSAVWGKSFRAGEKAYGHIIDPRTGYPADHTLLAAIILPSATEADALTTALLIDGKTKHQALAHLRPGMKTVVAVAGENPTGILAEAHGITLLPGVPPMRATTSW